MPEGPEVPTETLTEEIREEFEHEGGALLKRVALSTALFAASIAADISGLVTVTLLGLGRLVVVQSTYAQPRAPVAISLTNVLNLLRTSSTWLLMASRSDA